MWRGSGTASGAPAGRYGLTSDRAGRDKLAAPPVPLGSQVRKDSRCGRRSQLDGQLTSARSGWRESCLGVHGSDLPLGHRHEEPYIADEDPAVAIDRTNSSLARKHHAWDVPERCYAPLGCRPEVMPESGVRWSEPNFLSHEQRT